MLIKCLDNSGTKNVDVVIVTSPWTDSSIPLMAPAALKPIVEKAGLTCLAVDLNGEIYAESCRQHNIDDIIKFFVDNECRTPEVQSWIFDVLQSAAKQIVAWNPKYLGISVFSYVCRASCLWLCYFVRKLRPDIKIILGGAGCLDTFSGPASFAQDLIDHGLADYHVRGDGENSLYELLIGNTGFIGINSAEWQQLAQQELESLPHPDYSNYDFSIYKKKVLQLQGSRGCVRKCTFCDYIANWKRFQWRTANDIFDEMVKQYQKYKIRNFKFQDSLTNGNLKEFTQLTRLLADYNKAHPDENFKWSGYYIFREKTATDNQLWQLVADSGAENLIVGIENLNPDIRYAIGKKFSNESIDYHLDRALEHNIKLSLLFITGYVSETQEHIDYSKQWLETHVKYQPIIFGLQWGGGLGIFPNTYLHKHQKELGVVMIGDKPHLWINPKTDSTPAKRAGWVHEFNAHSRKLGYSVPEALDNHFLLEMMLND